MIFPQHRRFQKTVARPNVTEGEEPWAYNPPSVVNEAKGAPKIVGKWLADEHMGASCVEDRRRRELKRVTPGPGAYNLQRKIYDPVKAPPLVSRKQHGGIFGNMRKGPGPGNYDVAHKMVKKSYNKKAGGGFRPDLPKKQKKDKELTKVIPFRIQGEKGRRMKTPLQASTASKPAYPVPQAPGIPLSSKEFSRHSGQNVHKTSPYRGRRLRSKSPSIGGGGGAPSPTVTTTLTSPTSPFAGFGIGAQTALKTSLHSAGSGSVTRLAASRSLPNSPRLMQHYNGHISPTASPPTGLVQCVKSPSPEGDVFITNRPPSADKSSRKRGGGKITKLIWTTPSGKTATHVVPEGRGSRPITPSSTREDGRRSRGSTPGEDVAARRRAWAKYEFSSDDDDDVGVDDETTFHGLNQNSEDSRHFYIPPLNHEGLLIRSKSGAPGAPIHLRTTKATEEAHKNPSSYMREIRGALDDLKVLAKMQILSPRSSPRPRSASNPRSPW